MAIIKRQNINRLIAIVSVTIFFLLLSISFAYFVGLRNETSNASTSRIVNGVVDYRSVNFDDLQNTTISGETFFYWKKLLCYDDFKDSIPKCDALAPIPDIWNNVEVDGKKVGGYGYATYYFKILLPDDKQYGVTMRELDCAYNIWVNGEYLETGKVGMTKESTKPSWKRNTVYFFPKNGVAEVILQVSNFQHYKGGAEDAIRIGRMKAILYYKYTQIGISLLLFGVLIIVLAYHLLLYSNCTSNKSLIYFSLVCFAFLIRLLFTGEKLMYELFPSFDWTIGVKLEYISFKVVLPLMLGFVHYMYPNEVSKKIRNVITIVSLIDCLFVAVTPVHVFSITTKATLVYISIGSLYIVYVSFLALLRKRENALIFFLGFIIFFAIVLNDILFYSKLTSINYLLPFGVFILVFSQATVISLKLSKSLQDAEQYRLVLEQYNRELEKKVKKRTSQIEQAKNKLQQQADVLIDTNKQLQELSSFKEGMMGMIVHDLKNPLNIVLNFAKEEKVVYAAKQMLNLVHNILDVQHYEQSSMQLSRRPIAIMQLINQAVLQVGYLFREKMLTLDNNCYNRIVVNVDENVMTRVIVNLLINAQKYSYVQGTVSISSKTEGDDVFIMIKDEGSGIAKDKQDLIFQKFGQINKINSGETESTGIGLAFCKIAVEAHDGIIGLDSDEGKGSTFWIKLAMFESSDKLLSDKPFGSERIDGFSTKYIELSDSEKLLIREQIKRLRSLKVYEVSKVKKILSNIEKLNRQELVEWLASVNKSIWSGNQKEYDALIKKGSLATEDSNEQD